jgi:hypothetical protein
MEAFFYEITDKKVGLKKSKGKNNDDVDEEDMEVIKDYNKWKIKYEQ